MPYTITPLRVGEFKSFEKSRFTYDRNYGEKIDVAIIAWLVRGEGRNILIDSGPPLQEAQGNKHDLNMDLGNGGLLKELAHFGLDPIDIDTIILTHLHWDHAYNLELFPQAQLYVQKRELEYAVNPLPLHRITYEVGIINSSPYWAPFLGRFNVLDGNEELFDGIKILLLPGHTPGLQGVLVDTVEGRYLIASDSFPLFENIEESIPNGIHVDLLAWFTSLAIIKKTDATILPGHDLKVFKRRIYGL
ncbi:MAG: N-acyl homoserine lactonase family protein [Sphaerochaeta sp.]|nr:N-acyl homoserine lactonase family protein [Sphaerochaeta sp.]